MRKHTDPVRRLRTTLRVLVLLTMLSIAGCDWLGITEAPDPEGVLALSAAPATAPADGTSLVVVTAQVDTTAEPAVATVTFATTLGTFGTAATVAAPVDEHGRARAQLKAPADTGTAIVTATVPGGTSSLLVSFTAPVNGFTGLSASPPTAPADGASTTIVTAQVNTAAVPAVSEVQFTTTLGAFPGATTTATVPVDETGVARAQLRAPADTGTAIITARAGGATRTVTVGFLPAPPTRLELTSDKFVLPSGLEHSVSLMATPLRDVGSPSPGTVVTFSADTVGGSGGGFGQFSAKSLLLRSGSATSRFSAGETSYHGQVVIRATATQAGQTVRDSTIVTVSKPPS